ncbi:17692_t:CDS:2 [Gigaspora margarita]|uniref:17692_t:CDS:1 n=1 Tax=Gigaspora margarita TaxID=4874 RepID=A0ABN7VS21_GIGMA|nr:17692_t:CDS:2 [Gigaspora margarita]
MSYFDPSQDEAFESSLYDLCGVVQNSYNMTNENIELANELSFLTAEYIQHAKESKL